MTSMEGRNWGRGRLISRVHYNPFETKTTTNFLVPNCILYLLSSLVYLIPVDSGEKISFAITILLAQFVSLGMIYDLLPPSSLSFPRVGYFCEAAICHMAIDVCLSIVGKTKTFCRKMWKSHINY